MSKPEEASAGPTSRLSSTILNLKFMQRAQEKKAKVVEVQAREERNDEVSGGGGSSGAGAIRRRLL